MTTLRDKKQLRAYTGRTPDDRLRHSAGMGLGEQERLSPPIWPIIVVLALVVIFLAGCELKPFEMASWQTAPEDYTCTPEQMTRAQTEAAWCSENTSYLSSYCYGTAIMRDCTKKALNK